MKIILDISANTHKNDEKYYRRMIEVIHDIEGMATPFKDNDPLYKPYPKKEIIIKGQLFLQAGKNIPQDFALFERMARWTYATYGYETTASVFDRVSLYLLMLMDVPYELPFIKIANNRKLDWLIGEVPRKIVVYASIDSGKDDPFKHRESIVTLRCVSKYPALVDEYVLEDGWYPPNAISDHTIGLDLVKKYKPTIYECHFVLEHDPNNLDGGPWAKTPAELREILCI